MTNELKDADRAPIGIRLVAERKRLKFLQADLISKAGISKPTQIDYETGRTHPNSIYLVFLYNLGFDVMYILTGVYSQSRPEHQALIAAYQAAPEILRHAAFAVLYSEKKP